MNAGQCNGNMLLTVFFDVLGWFSLCVCASSNQCLNKVQAGIRSYRGECPLCEFLWIIISNITLYITMHLSLIWLSSFVFVGIFLGCSAYFLFYLSGFGGLVVSVLASSTQDRGFKPGRSRRIFWAKKILSTPSFGSLSHVADLQHVKDPWKLCESRVFRRNLLAISRPFPILATRGLSCRLTWSPSGVDGQN